MNRNAWIAVGVGIFVVGYFVFGGNALSIFNKSSINQAVPSTVKIDETPSTNMSDLQNTQNIPASSEFQIKDMVVGTGAEAVSGKIITVHYVGTLTNGQKFDSSVDRGQPFEFALGAGQVIAGWDQGFAGMKVGGKRILTIPPEMGYGAGQVGPIPPNSTLIFEVELLGVGK